MFQKKVEEAHCNNNLLVLANGKAEHLVWSQLGELLQELLRNNGSGRGACSLGPFVDVLGDETHRLKFFYLQFDSLSVFA